MPSSTFCERDVGCPTRQSHQSRQDSSAPGRCLGTLCVRQTERIEVLHHELQRRVSMPWSYDRPFEIAHRAAKGAALRVECLVDQRVIVEVDRAVVIEVAVEPASSRGC